VNDKARKEFENILASSEVGEDVKGLVRAAFERGYEAGHRDGMDLAMQMQAQVNKVTASLSLFGGR